MKLRPVITCEHAGNNVPSDYMHLFKDCDDVLLSHRGWDPGAIEIATALSKELSAPFFMCETTRLLVEPNRSLHSDSLFSEYTLALTDAQKSGLLNNYYHPHRTAVEEFIQKSQEAVLHLSIHTFTPIWNDVERKVDVGLLYDPDRGNESSFCEACASLLRRDLSALNVEFNEPYKGVDDGFTTYLRTKFANDRYMGIEIEINQKFVGTEYLNSITATLARALLECNLL